MHIEFVIEDESGGKLLDAILPKLLGPQGDVHTWRMHKYKGIGRIPTNLGKSADPAKRMLLDQLPRILKGYAKTPGIDAVVVILDSDARDCRGFLKELKGMTHDMPSTPTILFRLAIEEMEAWYFGDRAALLQAYPKAKKDVLDRYKQDSVCQTWELLADAIYPGGFAAIKKEGWPLPGQVKYEWAERIGPLLVPDANVSPSFGKLRDGLHRLTSTSC